MLNVFVQRNNLFQTLMPRVIGLLCVCMFSGLVLFAQPATTEAVNLGSWATATAAGDDDQWQSVTYGNGRFVAVSDSGDRVMTSTNGTTWATTSAAGNDDEWYSVTYGNGRFVAVAAGGSGDHVMYSDDGVNWTAVSAGGDDDYWFSVTYGNGRFVAAGSSPGNDRMMYSDDGITWATTTVAGNDDNWQSVTYGNGRFVAVGTGLIDNVVYSEDGINWIALNAPLGFWGSVTYGNGRFVAVSNDGDGDVMYSYNGSEWISVETNTANVVDGSVAFGNNLFINVTNGAYISYSPDGVTWFQQSTSNCAWSNVVYGGDKFVAVCLAGGGSSSMYAPSLPWSLTQTGFQFRNDNGSEITATSIKGQNSTLEFPVNVPVRLRTQIDSQLATTTTPYYLQYKNTGTESGWHTVGVDDPFPWIRSSGSSLFAGENTTHNLVLEQECVVGDLILVIFSHDGVGTSQSTSTGWVKLGEASNGVSVTGAIYYKFSDGNDNLVVRTVVVENITSQSYCIAGAGTPTASVANGSGANSNPPLHITDAVRQQLFFATRSSDDRVVASAGPAGFSQVESVQALFATGVSSDVAFQYSHASSSDPGSFTSASEQWVSWTIAVPPRQTPTVGTLEAAVNPTPATSTNNSGYGSIAWTNPERATSSDQQRASLTVSSTTASNYLDVTQWGFTIPSNATITGITAGVEKSRTSGGGVGEIRDNSVRLIKAGTVVGNNYADTVTNWPATDATSQYGTSSNLWGTSWTPAEINASNFGIAIAAAGAAAGANRVANIDHVTINVYYTVPAPFTFAPTTNIATNGASTTARMIAPTIHTKADFTGGHITEDQSPTPAVTIRNSSYTELEWSLVATGTASTSDNYEFRTSIGLDAPVESNVGTIIFTIAPTTTTAFITLSGTAYTDLGSTTVGSGQEIVLALGETNPVLYSTTTSTGGGFTINVATSTGNTFVPVTTDKSNDTIVSVAYGRGLYVALTTSDVILTSRNGIKWTRQFGTVSGIDWKDIVYGKGLFVAVGLNDGESGNSIMYSENGIDWFESYFESGVASQSWTSVTYGRGRFVAVGDNYARAMYSDDGINWMLIDSGVAGDDDAWSSVTYGNKRFTAVSTSGNTRVMTSTDGVTWTARSAAGNDDSWTGITYGNGRFIAIANSGNDRAMYSSDGISWTAVAAAGNDDSWSSVKYGNGRYLAIGKGGDNRAMSSLDGINWIAQVTRKNNHAWNKVTFGNGKFIIVGNPSGGDRVTTLDPGIGPDTAVVVYRKATSSPSTTFIGGLDGLGTLSGIPLYGNTMLVYNATTSATTSVTSLDDLAFFDSSNDSNVLYTASSTGASRILVDMISATGTVEYKGLNLTTDAHTEIKGVLTLEGARDVTLGSVTIFPGAELNAPTNLLTIVGNYTNNGTFTNNNGTTTFLGQMPYNTEVPYLQNATTTGESILGLSLSDDGTKLYTATFSNVLEYTLTTPYDLTAGSLTFNLDSNSDGFYITNENLMFANDGRKMYVSGWQNDTIKEYTLSTPWSLSTAAFTASTSLNNGFGNFSQSFHISNDGRHLYSTAGSPNRVRQFRLTTPYSITSAVFVASTTQDTIGEFGLPRTALWVSPDGRYMIRGISDNTPTSVGRFRMATPWDITSVVYDTSGVSVLPELLSRQIFSGDVASLWMDKTGVRMVATPGQGIASYRLGAELAGVMTATSSFANVEFQTGKVVFNSAASTTDFINSSAFVKAPTTTLSVAGNYNNNFITEHASFNGELRLTGSGTVAGSGGAELTGSSSLNNLVVSGNYSFPSGTTTVRDMTITSGASVSFRTDFGSSTLDIFGNYTNNGTSSLASTTILTSSGGFDLRNATTVADYSLVAETTSPRALAFSATGTYMYVFDNTLGRVLAYELGIPWEVATARYLYATSTAARVSDGRGGLAFKTDGTSMFVGDESNNRIVEFSLSSPWDIRTSAYVASSTSECCGLLSMAFSPDGTQFYQTTISGGGSVNQFTLAIPWSLGNILHNSPQFTDSYINRSSYPTMLAISPDGRKLFMNGTGSFVRQYTMRIPHNLNSIYAVDDLNIGMTSFQDEMALNASGTKLYVLSSDGDYIRQFNLLETQTLAGTLTGTSSPANLRASSTLPVYIASAASTANFTIATSSLVYAPTSTLAISGNFENRGTFIPRAGTTTLSGTGKTITGNLTSWNDATGPDYGLTNVTGSYTYLGNGTTSALTIDAGGELTAPAGGILAVAHNFTNNGTFINNGATTAFSGNLSGTTTGTSTLGNTVINARSQAMEWQAIATSSAAGNNDTWEAITYGNGRFVAVGGSAIDNVMTSTDGLTWATTSAAGNNDDLWQSVTYGNGRFVAVSIFSNDRVMTSTDGLTWAITSAAGNDDNWYDVTYGNGRFVAVGTGPGTDYVMYSDDGLTWATTSAAGNDDEWLSVTYGDGKFVAVGNDTVGDGVMYSIDGLTWATASSGVNSVYTSVTYGNGRFVAVTGYDEGSPVIYSLDGINWIRVPNAPNALWESVTYGNGRFVAVGGGPATDRVMTSTDGISWATTSVAGNDDWLQAVTYANGRFVAVGSGGDDRVMTSVGASLFNDNASTSNLTINASSTLNASGTTISVEGNYTNSGTLTASTSTFIFDGTSTQVATGTLSASSSFNNLIIANTSGSGSSSQSVQFGAPVTATGTMTMLASTSVRFVASSTNTFNNVTLLGGTSSPVWLRSSVPGTTWNLDINGTQDVSYVNVRDSDATITNGGVANPGGFDGGNNINWLFDTFVPTWNDTDWILYDTITIQQENIDADLTDFPVYVNLADLSSTFWSTTPTGSSTVGTDIRVTTVDNVEVPRELVFASSTAQTGELHFKAPTISSTTDTVFKIWYNGTTTGDYATSDTYGAENVWTNDFVAVYHLQEDPSGGVGAVLDSTRFNHDGTGSTTMTSADLVTGKLGRGYDFDGGALTDSVTVGTSTRLANLNTVSVCTWYEHDTYTATYGQLIDKSTNGIDSWNLYVEEPSGFTMFGRAGGFQYADTVFSGWSYICATTNGAGGADGVTTYKNGVVNETLGDTFAVGSDDSNIPLTLGAGKTDSLLDGRMDEVRIASTTRTAAWIKAEYTNQSTTTDFYATAGSSAAIVALGNHPLGQINNTFSGSDKADETLFAFTLEPNSEAASTTVTLLLANTIGLDETNLSDWRLYRDSNANQEIDGGDVQVGGAGMFSTSSVFFGTSFLANASHSYIVTADITNIEQGDRITISLSSESIIATSTETGLILPVVGAVSSTNHLRSKKGGGGGSVNFINIGAPGNGIETGGGNTGGEELGGQPNFNPPTTTGTPHNEWTSGASGYLSDGAYATEVTAGERQSYGTYGFNIPDNNEITGIEVKLEASASTPAGTIEVALSWDNGNSITTIQTTATLSTTDTIYTLGSPSDLWGRVWVPSEFTNGTFGVRIIGQPSGGNTVRVDAMQVRVYHQATGGGTGGGAGEL